jgi:hypothetical protein
LVDGALDLLTFWVRTTLGRADVASGVGRDLALDEIGAILKPAEGSVRFDELIREVADRLDTDPSLVRERVRNAKPLPETATTAPSEPEPARERPRGPLTPREARERALLTMCIADPKKGRPFIDRLAPEQLSPSGAKALEWLKGHLDAPTAGLPREDEELYSLVTELVMRSERGEGSDWASERAMELNFMLLEQERLERGITAAREAGRDDEQARLIAERAALRDRISHAESVGV